LKISGNAIIFSDDQWEMWNLYYYNEIEKLSERDDNWDVMEEFRRTFEHIDLREKYWNSNGKKVLVDDNKQQRCE
jgi:hypothetical protein